jgi:hypothetical protein
MGPLTRQLQNKEGPVWKFLAGCLDATSIKAIRLEAKPLFAAASTILAAPMPSWEHALIGTAVDYRIRYALAFTPASQLVAYHGAAWLATPSMGLDGEDDLDLPDMPRSLYRLRRPGEPDPGPLAHAAQTFLGGLDAAILRLNPVRRRLASSDEEMLARDCIVLAALEQVFRSGMLGERSLLISPTPCTTVAELLARAQPAWVEDLCAMGSAFHDVAERYGLFDVTSVLNPTFAGSQDMNADADLVLGSCLVDVKTTIRPYIPLEVLAQLLGYALLDYPDEFGIDSVGMYFARQALLLRWPLARLLGHALSKQEVADTRAEFQRMLREAPKK